MVCHEVFDMVYDIVTMRRPSTRRLRCSLEHRLEQMITGHVLVRSLACKHSVDVYIPSKQAVAGSTPVSRSKPL